MQEPNQGELRQVERAGRPDPYTENELELLSIFGITEEAGLKMIQELRDSKREIAALKGLLKRAWNFPGPPESAEQGTRLSQWHLLNIEIDEALR